MSHRAQNFLMFVFLTILTHFIRRDTYFNTVPADLQPVATYWWNFELKVWLTYRDMNHGLYWHFWTFAWFHANLPYSLFPFWLHLHDLMNFWLKNWITSPNAPQSCKTWKKYTSIKVDIYVYGLSQSIWYPYILNKPYVNGVTLS